MRYLILFFTIIGFSGWPSILWSASTQKLVVSQASDETPDPPVELAIEWAWQKAGLRDGREAEWAVGVRRAGWLPRMEVGGEVRGESRDGESESDAISVSSAGVTIGPPERGWLWYQRETWRISAKAVWELDKVAFNRDSLGVSQERRRLSEERMALADKVVQLYFERERWRPAILSGKCRDDDRRKWNEAGALLNAITGTTHFGGSR